MEKNKLNGCYVRQNGKIFPWGMVRVFDNSVVDDPKDNKYGLAYWSSKLIPYGNENYYAKVINDRIVVFEKETDKKVISIRKDNLFASTSVWVKMVTEMGYLFATGTLGLNFSNNNWSHTLNALKKVAQGQPAPYCDNSPFAKVSEELIGTELIFLDLNLGIEEKNYKVFTFDGKPVDFQISYPLRVS